MYSNSFPFSVRRTPLSFNSQVPWLLKTFLKFVETHRGSLWHSKPQDIRLARWNVLNVKPLSRRWLRVITGQERDASLQRIAWDTSTSDINNPTRIPHRKKIHLVFFPSRDFAFGVYTQLCKSFENISINLKGVQRRLFNIFLSNRSQVERMLWELNKRMINIVIVHYILKRHILNTEIYHLIQGMKNKTKNKQKMWILHSLKIQI